MGGKILAAAILIACVPLGMANAQLGKDASYFCAEDISAGLVFDQRTKQWKSTTFRADKKFVLRLKLLETHKSPADINRYKYNVTITDAGFSEPWKCLNSHLSSTGTGDDPVVVLDLFDVFWCTAGGHEFKFNFKNNRFLRASLIGYVDGKDDRDTPSIDGGTCTKID